MRGCLPELGFVRSKSEAFTLNEVSICIQTSEDEIPIVRNQHLSIAIEIATHLFALDNRIDLIAGWLNFDSSARRKLAFDQFALSALLKLIGREEAAVGKTCAFVRNVDDAANARLERLSYFVE